MTSLAFMFDEVPEPVWKTSIGNWLSCSPAATASAAFGDRVGDARVEPVELGVGARGGALDAAEPVDRPTAGRSRRRWGSCRRPSWSRRRRASSSLPWRIRLWPSAAERGQLAADADGVVVGDEEARAAEHAQLRVGQQVERLLGRLERVQRVLVGPQQQRRGGRCARSASSSSRRARTRPRAREGRPRAREVRVAADVGERVADEVARGRVRRAR